MEINKDTRIADILNTYGDIAKVMEVFGIQRVGRYSVRALAARALTVEWAARIHRVPLDEFLVILRKAIASDPQGSTVLFIQSRIANTSHHRIESQPKEAQ